MVEDAAGTMRAGAPFDVPGDDPRLSRGRGFAVPQVWDLVERDAELESLEAAFADARRGQGSIVLIGGVAGVGKTALVDEFMRRHEPDARILWGGCDDLATPRTLGPFRDIALQVGGSLEQVLASGGARIEVFDAALDAVGISRAPTLAVIEDAHWADGATLDVLKFVGKRIGRTNAVLLVTFREENVPADHPLRLVMGDMPAASLRRIDLGPLSRTAVGQLAVDFAGSTDELFAVTGGNPFFVTEVLREPTSRVPASVRDAMRARAEHLSVEAREIIEVASVVPGHVERWLLATVAHDDPDVLDECESRGLLIVGDRAVWYRHELARRAVEQSLPAPRRRELNQMVLDVLVDRDADVARIMHHAREAEDAARLVGFGPSAGDQASAASAHMDALSCYRLAVEHVDRIDPQEQAELLSRYAIEGYLTNQAVEALDAAERALELWRRLDQRERQGEMLRWISRLQWWLGRGSEAERSGVAAIDVLEQLPPNRQLALAHSNLSQLHMLAHRSEEAQAWATKAIDAARTLHDDDTLAHALNNLGSARARLGDPSGVALLEESLEIALAGGFEDHAGRGYANLIWITLDNRDYALAEQKLAEGIEYTTRHELGGSLYYMVAERARLRFETGDWHRAEEDVRWVVGRPEEPGITRMPALAVWARLRVRRGDPEAAESLDAAWELAYPTGEMQRIGPVAAARAEYAWLNGDVDALGAAVGDVDEFAVVVHQPRVIDEVAFWRWRAGKKPDPPRDPSTPYWLQINGDWREAAQRWSEVGCPYERATALSDGDDPKALLDALEIFDSLDARPAGRLVRDRLRDMGVHTVPRGPRGTTRAHPAGLTPRQVDVLVLIAEGLTNQQIAERLFVSSKTVDHHVSAVLAKLEVSSRGEAAAVARERGLIPE
jgi:DNA-binding CsgD family transcriptional regulator/tetratricopeptide (TPR) repeat protein